MMWSSAVLVLCVCLCNILSPGLGTPLLYEEESTKGENEECRREAGQVWRCKKDTECPSLKLILQDRGTVTSCSWKDATTHLICCPPAPSPTPDTQTPRVSEKKCLEYRETLCRGHHGSYSRVRRSYHSDGTLVLSIPLSKSSDSPRVRVRRQTTPNHSSTWREEEYEVTPNPADLAVPPTPGVGYPAAVGGIDAAAMQHPHMALVGYGTDENRVEWSCGGSLVSELWVLSAAHCSQTSIGPASWVRLGELDLGSETEDARLQQFSIVERVKHPDYKSPAYYNDLVLFRLDRAAVLDPYVRPACLHQDMGDPLGVALATGWGRNDTNSPRAKKLQEVRLKFVSSEECKRSVGNVDRFLPEGVDTETMICAGEPGKDTCKGDSGGPLILNDYDRCVSTLVGVTSFGPSECGSAVATGTYVRVAYYLSWIESVVWPIDDNVDSGNDYIEALETMQGAEKQDIKEAQVPREVTSTGHSCNSCFCPCE